MLYLTTETDLAVGQPCQSHAQSPLTPHFAVVFEDDGQTGYFYALDTRNEQQPIATALHIYNVDNVTDAQLLGKIQICWHHQQDIAVLFINNYPHAAFHFGEKVGQSRNNGFPAPDENSGWQHTSLNEAQINQWYKEE